jgi:hypothetical protein
VVLGSEGAGLLGEGRRDVRCLPDEIHEVLDFVFDSGQDLDARGSRDFTWLATGLN